jgi:hypothetical protein
MRFEGKLDEAKTALAKALRLNPQLSANGLTAGCPRKEFGCLKYARGYSGGESNDRFPRAP